MGVASHTVASGVDQIDTYTGIEPARVVARVREMAALGLGQLVALRRYGVTHAVVPADVDEEHKAPKGAATVGGRRIGTAAYGLLEVWALPHRPWASFAERVAWVATEADAGRAVVELESAGDPAVVLLGTGPAAASPGTVLEGDRSAESLRVVAEAPGDGVLVVNDAEWPGWEATIDGRPAGIQLADGLVRAVRWPAGRHVLEMTYRPRELRVGLAASAAGALALIALALRRREPCARPRPARPGA
jgi:hypothetical protein